MMLLILLVGLAGYVCGRILWKERKEIAITIEVRDWESPILTNALIVLMFLLVFVFLFIHLIQLA